MYWDSCLIYSLNSKNYLHSVKISTLMEILFQWLQLHCSEHSDTGMKGLCCIHHPTDILYILTYDLLEHSQSTGQVCLTRSFRDAHRQHKMQSLGTFTPATESGAEAALHIRWTCLSHGQRSCWTWASTKLACQVLWVRLHTFRFSAAWHQGTRGLSSHTACPYSYSYNDRCCWSLVPLTWGVILSPRGTSVLSRLALKESNYHQQHHYHVIGHKVEQFQ